MWRAFWVNVACGKAKWLNEDRKWRVLNRAVKTRLIFRCARWPPIASLQTRVGHVQKRMIATVRRLRRAPGEDPAIFARRRARDAGRIARDSCCWQKCLAERAGAWHDHLCRERNSSSWPARLLTDRGAQWIHEERRMERGGAEQAPARSQADQVHFGMRLSS